MGFIWLGTQGGLCRWDGYEMQTYQFDKQDSTSLSDSFVHKLFLDCDGTLWVATDMGLSRYCPQQDSFRNYYPAKKTAMVSDMYQTRDGAFFVSCSDLLYRYNPQTDSFVFAGLPDKIKINNVNDFYEDPHGVLWLACTNGLFFWDRVEERAARLMPRHEFPPLHNQHVTSLETDGKGRVFIGTHDNGLYIYDAATDSLSQLDIHNGLSSHVVRALMWNRGKLWIGTEMGVNIYDLATGNIDKLRYGREDVSGITDNAIYSIYQDNNHNIWVGTYFGGVNVYLKDFSYFTHYPYGYSHRHLSGKAVREIFSADSTHLWIATEDGGLQYLNTLSGEIRHFVGPDDSIPISYHNVHTVLVDSRGDLWVGTFTGGINRFNPRTGKMTYYNNRNTGCPVNIVFNLIEDRIRNTLVIGSVNGLSFYDFAQDRFYRAQDPNLKFRQIYCSHIDRQGTLWLGMRRSGLYTYDVDGQKAFPLLVDQENLGFVTGIADDADKNIWVATYEKGLLKYNMENGEHKFYTVAEGLPTNAVVSVTLDEHDRVWAGTNAGLVFLDPRTDSVAVFTSDNGLPINQFNFCSAHKAPNGFLYFGTVNGLVTFHPDSLLKPRTAPTDLHLRFTRFFMGNQEVQPGVKYQNRVLLPEHISLTRNITLSYKQAQLLVFNFTANHFSSSKEFYAFQLDQSPWHTIGTRPSLSLTRLRQGHHTLSVMATPDTTHWRPENRTTLSIHVKPPFYLSGWAWLLYALLAGGLAFVAFRIIQVRVALQNSVSLERKEKETLQVMNRQKIDFFTNVSHELKTPLTLILSPLRSMAQDQKLDDKYSHRLGVIADNAKRMLFLIDEMLSFSKAEMGQIKLTVQRGPILPFISKMCNIFSMVATDNNLHFKVDIDAHDETAVWFSPQIVEKITYNLLSNAFKYTPTDGDIRIKAQVDASGKVLTLEVSDTGIGIPEESLEKIFENYYQVNPSDGSKGSGIGLAFAKRLTELHKGTISVTSRVNQGSIFTVQLNVSENAYTEEQRSPVALDLREYAYTSPAIDKFDNSVLKDLRPIGDETRILVVEDNQDLNEYVSDLFKDRFAVSSAYDGAQGLEMARKLLPDLIISDIMMPKMDGYELTKILKSNLLTCHIPIVLLTAKTTDEDTVAGFEQGADAYIKKPFNAQRLEYQVNNIIATRRNQIKLFADSADQQAVPHTSNSRDKEFMDKVIGCINDNLSNEFFSVNDLTEHLSISRSMLYLKLKKLADVSANDLIKNIRMKAAMKKLREGYNVSETSYAVGIYDPNYFSKCFKKFTGLTPSEFQKQELNKG